MPNYNVEVFIHEEGEEETHKIVWVANYSDAATAIETAGRRAIGIANYMKKTSASIHNLGAITYERSATEDKKVVDLSGDLKKLTDYV